MAFLDLHGRIGPRPTQSYEGISRGIDGWRYEPGDSGDPSVGIGPTAPSIYVEVDGEDGERHVVEIAQPQEPIYGVDIGKCGPECPHLVRLHAVNDAQDDWCPVHEYDEGMRAVGNLHANATL